MASTTSERKIIKNFKKGGCGPLHDSATPLYFWLIKAECWCFHMRYILFLCQHWFFQNLEKGWREEVKKFVFVFIAAKIRWKTH
jgi:hypothetical protein